MAYAATPKKLSDGTWGAQIRTEVTPSVGDRCVITTQAGKTWEATITRVVGGRTDAGTYLVATRSATPKSGSVGRVRSGPAPRKSGSGRCRGCGGPIVHAAHHRATDGYCGGCAFDELDG